MYNAVMTVAATLLQTVPYQALCAIPFRRNLRSPRWLLLACWFSATGLHSWYNVLNNADGLNLRGMQAAGYAFLLLYALLFFTCFRANLWKMLFHLLLVSDFSIIVLGLASFLETRLYVLRAYLPGLGLHNLLNLILLLLLIPLMLRFFSRTVEMVYHTDAPQLWRAIWLLPALMTVIVLVFTGDMTVRNLGSWEYLFARICLLGGGLLVYFVLLQSLDGIAKNAKLSEQVRQQKIQNDLQAAQYAALQKHIEETRRIRHDLRQHLNVGMAYLQDGDLDALRDYLQTYAESLPSVGDITFCENYAVDAVVRHYIEQAHQAGVRTEASLALPAELAVAPQDLCVLLGNLLENAVEACARQRQGERFLHIRGMIAGSQSVALTVENSYDGEVRQTEGGFYSAKRPERGIGITSVQAIAERYGGVCKFTYDGGVFRASVLLTPPEQEEPRESEL